MPVVAVPKLFAPVPLEVAKVRFIKPVHSHKSYVASPFQAF